MIVSQIKRLVLLALAIPVTAGIIAHPQTFGAKNAPNVLGSPGDSISLRSVPIDPSLNLAVQDHFCLIFIVGTNGTGQWTAQACGGSSSGFDTTAIHNNVPAPQNVIGPVNGPDGTAFQTLTQVLADLATLVKKTGDAMSGPLVLPGDPTLDNQAATKHYVDTKLSTGSVNLPDALVRGHGTGQPASAAASSDVTGTFKTQTIVPSIRMSTHFNEAANGSILQGTAPLIGVAGATWQYGETGTAWAYQTGGGVTAGGSPTPAPFTGGAFINVAATDYTLNISFTSQGGTSLVMVRYADANNLAFANITGGGLVQLINQVAGVQTILSVNQAMDIANLHINVAGQTITVTDGNANHAPIVGTMAAGTNTSATNVGFSMYGGTNATVSSMSVNTAASTVNSACTGAMFGDGICRTVIPNAAAMVSGSSSGTGISIGEIQTSDNGDGTGVLSCQEDHKRGIYDPRCIQYAGGLAAAITPAQQQTVLQATLDQAACDEVDGKISSATVMYPSGYNSSISDLLVHTNITLKCAGSEGMLFGGGCGLTDSYQNPVPSPGSVTATPSATGGTLAAGTHFYVVTAIANARFNPHESIVSIESLGSAEVSAVTTGATGSVTVSWAPVAGATNYLVYRGTAAGLETVFYNTVTAVTSYVDTNAAVAGTRPVGSGAGQPMIRLDFTNHGMCHGTDTTFGGGNAAVIGFNFAGAGAIGAADTGVLAFAVHNLVSHNTFNNFGGPAVVMSGAPGDGVSEWNFITNSPTYYTQNPNLMPPAPTGALACVGEDTSCYFNEVSTGAPFFRGNWIRPANYGLVGAILVDGGGARISNNFMQISDLGLLVACCAGANQISDLRFDFMAGSAILNETGSVFSGISINNPCMDPNSVDATNHVSNCSAISGDGSYSGITVGPFGGFGASFLGSVFDVAGGTYGSIENGYGPDGIGNGVDFRNTNAGFSGLAAPAGAQQITNSCSFNGKTDNVQTNGCAHIQFTDTTPTFINSLSQLGDGKTFTIEGTSNDTLVNGAFSFGASPFITCSGANVTLGNGPLSFFFTTRDTFIHEICDRNADFVTYNWVGQTPPAAVNQFTLDTFGTLTMRQIPQPTVTVGSAGLSPNSFSYCYVAAATVFGEPSSSAPVCSNLTPPSGSGSGGAPFVLLTSTFPTGWESGEVDLNSTTDPAFTPGKLASFTPSRQPGSTQTFGTVYTTTLITPSGTPKAPNVNGTGGLNEHRAVPASSTEQCPDGDLAFGAGPGASFGIWKCHPANTWSFNPSGGTGGSTGTVPTSNLSGFLLAANFPALSGDISNTPGSLALQINAIQGISIGGVQGSSGNDVLLSSDPPGGATGAVFCRDSLGNATTVGCVTATGVNATQLQSIPVASSAPADGQSLVFNAAAGSYVPTTKTAVAPTQIGVDAVKDLGLDPTDTNDVGAKLNTLLSFNVKCSPTVTSSCVPSWINFPAGVYKITTMIHPANFKWGDLVLNCESSASPYAGGNVIFDVRVPDGQDGFYWDTNPSQMHSPEPRGCSIIDGNAYNWATQTLRTTASNTRALWHLSNINDIKGMNNSLQFAVGNTFNPNGVNGGAAVTTGQPCVVTANSYVVTCTGSTVTTAQAAMFGEGMFMSLGYPSEIYQAALSGTTLTITLATPYQHPSGTLFNWVVQYNGHALLIDGFGLLRTANGNTGTAVGFSQYGGMFNTFGYCNKYGIFLGGGGAQSFLSGGAANGSGGGAQSSSIYGTSRFKFIGGWFQGACPSNSNPMAPNGRVADSIAFWMGGLSDTMEMDVDENVHTFGAVVENGHQNTVGGKFEAAGPKPENLTCTAALASEDCTTGVLIGGDQASGSHGANNQVTAYALSYGKGIELLGSANNTQIWAQIHGGNIVNLQDIVLPSVGDTNCTSVTGCAGIVSTQINGAAGIYKFAAVTPPTNGTACSLPFEERHGTDGATYTCTSSLVWFKH